MPFCHASSFLKVDNGCTVVNKGQKCGKQKNTSKQLIQSCEFNTSKEIKPRFCAILQVETMLLDYKI
jgi:hypothetical protein